MKSSPYQYTFICSKVNVNLSRCDGDLGSHLFVSLKSSIYLSLGYSPVNDPLNHLVYVEDGSTVDTVLIDGEVVMKNRKNPYVR